MITLPTNHPYFFTCPSCGCKLISVSTGNMRQISQEIAAHVVASESRVRSAPNPLRLEH